MLQLVRLDQLPRAGQEHICFFTLHLSILFVKFDGTCHAGRSRHDMRACLQHSAGGRAVRSMHRLDTSPPISSCGIHVHGLSVQVCFFKKFYMQKMVSSMLMMLSLLVFLLARLACIFSSKTRTNLELPNSSYVGHMRPN
jgi:hypothetical protein